MTSDEVDFGEISIFVGPSFVITVRQGVASELHGARTRLEQHPKLLALGTNSVLWAILDQVIKGYAPRRRRPRIRHRTGRRHRLLRRGRTDRTDL